MALINWSLQNPVDLWAENWDFNVKKGHFYNWKNSPLCDYQLVKQNVGCQFSTPTSVNLSDIVVNVHDGYSGQIIGGTPVTDWNATINGLKWWSFGVSAADMPESDMRYIRITITDTDGVDHYFRSSTFRVSNDLTNQIQIKFTDTSHTIKRGMYFRNGFNFYRYLIAPLHDTVFDTGEEDTMNDFGGNPIQINKTFHEISTYLIQGMPLKEFVGLTEIARCDTIYINGRRALLDFEIQTEAEKKLTAGVTDVLINAFLKVTFADNDGLLGTNESSSQQPYLARYTVFLPDESKINIKTDEFLTII